MVESINIRKNLLYSQIITHVNVFFGADKYRDMMAINNGRCWEGRR
jgi:hypothetical protein